MAEAPSSGAPKKCAPPLVVGTSESSITVKLTVPGSSVPISDVEVRYTSAADPPTSGPRASSYWGGGKVTVESVKDCLPLHARKPLEPTSEHELTLTGLEPATTYTVRLRAKGSSGRWGQFSAATSVNTTERPAAGGCAAGAASSDSSGARREEDGESCRVCMSRPRSVRNQPCGHATLCELCTIKWIKSRTIHCPLCRCAVTSFKFLPATVQGEQRQTMMATYEQVPTDNEASPWPAELRQAAALLEQGELRQALEKATSVVGALELKLQASLAEPEPTGEAGAQAFATLLEFLQAMLDSDSEEVAAAAREQVQRWEGGEEEEEEEGSPPGAGSLTAGDRALRGARRRSGRGSRGVDASSRRLDERVHR